ncbi:MAG: hypothetical protein JRD89_12010 [Deltaproteobacteria bacterium]|nr:hypothetical protein [Deltaproteobacteria bacterium]
MALAIRREWDGLRWRVKQPGPLGGPGGGCGLCGNVRGVVVLHASIGESGVLDALFVDVDGAHCDEGVRVRGEDADAGSVKTPAGDLWASEVGE